MLSKSRIFLSPPDVGTEEQQLVAEVFASNWIAPLGPHVDQFEAEFAETVGSPNAVALNSGTGALHIALILAGVGPGDVVLVSTLTFSASVNPILYVGATPHFIDCDRATWNMDPGLLEQALREYKRKGKLPKAVIPVHVYGQSAEMDRITDVCHAYGVPMIEDAAEALGASYRDRAPGTFGEFGIFSFNGNKIITTSGGGMLVTPNKAAADRARKLSTQARENAPHYEHREIGYNYRLSNLLAAVGIGQLRKLEEKVEKRRRIFQYYLETLGNLPGIEFMPEAPNGRHTRWLTVCTIDPAQFGADTTTVRLALEARNIEARPVWKPMHLQPVFEQYPITGGAVSAEFFLKGLCLPSGSSMTPDMLRRVSDVVREECAFTQTADPVAR